MGAAGPRIPQCPRESYGVSQLHFQWWWFWTSDGTDNNSDKAQFSCPYSPVVKRKVDSLFTSTKTAGMFPCTTSSQPSDSAVYVCAWEHSTPQAPAAKTQTYWTLANPELELAWFEKYLLYKNISSTTHSVITLISPITSHHFFITHWIWLLLPIFLWVLDYLMMHGQHISGYLPK